MSLFDKAKRAVSAGISDGLGKGLREAVGEAVGKAVAPAAEKLAGKAAAQVSEQMEEAGAALGESMAALNHADAQLRQNVAELEAEGKTVPGVSGGFAGLGAAVAGLQQQAEAYATELAAKMKECPECGELSPADKTFCPHCGARLPDHTMAAGTLCPHCGKQNPPETRFCTDCGTVLPAYKEQYEQEQAERKAAEEAERRAAEEAERRAAAKAKPSLPTDELRKGLKDLRGKAEDLGGAAAGKALDAAASLFGKFKK